MVDIKDWPILLVTSDLSTHTGTHARTQEFINFLQDKHGLRVIQSISYEDAYEVFVSRADISCVIVDWNLPDIYPTERMHPETLVARVYERNQPLPIVLMTSRMETGALPTNALHMIDECIWINADTIEFLAGRVVTLVNRYLESVPPPFFGMLMKYAEEYKYAWHTPGHMGGTGFLRGPAGVAFFNFFGENTLRSDLSISVPELGSLLDHSGVCGDAERNSAKAFGADMTYYVLNGTSNVNQIIWVSQVSEGDLALVDRNCHKSLNYAMVRTDALPMYLVPRRNHLGLIGPVRLSEFTDCAIDKKVALSTLIPESAKGAPIRMSTLTNSTYDGVCYNVTKIKEIVSKRVERLHFDEAWYAYAAFHPIYKDHFGMAHGEVKADDPPIFCSQSTHKLLTAFSQASMLHVKDGGTLHIEPALFNEAYMMYGSTSPQYSMIASLDVATKMMQDGGEAINRDIIITAVDLRKKMDELNAEYVKHGDWFFDMWQPKIVSVNGVKMPLRDAPSHYLASAQEVWALKADDPWHGFEDIEDNYVMVDPIKLTFVTPGVNLDGTLAGMGIPASVVTNYLIRFGLVCEKTDMYSFLLLNSIGTRKAKQGSLLAALINFKKAYDANLPLKDVLPDMVRDYPRAYDGVGLKDHCAALHAYIKKHRMMDAMRHAFEVIPDQAMSPKAAFKHVVRSSVEFIELKDAMNRIPAVMIVPYPPGIPVMMGGEILNDKAKAIYDYLIRRQDFENTFPGYESDIHGVERKEVGGKKYFTIMCIKEGAIV